MPPLKVCIGFQGRTCTRLSSGIRCAEHARAYEAWRTRGRPGPRQRGYDAQYDRNRATLRVSATATRCVLCGGRIDMSLPGSDPMGWTAHHLVPLARGGTGALANLRPAHALCNDSRNDRLG